MFCDIHAHLTEEDYKQDLPLVIERAKIENVNLIILVGIDIEDSKKLIEIIKKDKILYGNVGIHPHEADRIKEEDIKKIYNLLKEEKICGIGEIGLDFYKNYSQRENQIKVFKELVKIAKEFNLPMNIHLRESHREGLKILKEINYFKGVLHCFSGNEEILKSAIDLGLYISYSGVITFGSERLERLLKKTPLDRLLLETDAPYLTPVPKRGMRNEPSYIKYIYQKVSEVLEMEIKELERRIEENVKRLFTIN
ncbi:MAG: TatD family hydrolase [candidate division WOR-3 bacterium]|nr:TatD family hydrolase [candidate division WOR-3 bacterium]MCX7837117.1 TatD family hydrolase [candidate division WOR-3 bacterium]MDW8113991.1 TatD family hydrolase [candidate division WOR-3 bacterium]